MHFLNILSKMVAYFIHKGLVGQRLINLIPCGVFYDKKLRMVYEKIGLDKIYLSSPIHAIDGFGRTNTLKWLCEKVFYSKYQPSDPDTYVDIGSGYGHEILWLANRTSARIIAIEPNPETFLFLNVNVSHLENVQTLNSFVSTSKDGKVALHQDYASTKVQGDLGISVSSIDIKSLLNIYGPINFIKMNIEGAEKHVVEQDGIHSIPHILISCHDFKADKTKDSSYRTFESVKQSLLSKGYIVENLNIDSLPSKMWEESSKYWLYAHRPDC